MATITEDYVSFETAKLLKEKGFNEQCRDFYRQENGNWLHRNTYEYNYFNLQMPRWKDCYACPTLSMVMKWLRELHNLHIITIPYAPIDRPSYHPGEANIVYIAQLFRGIIPIDEIGRSIIKLTPEAACEASIKYCLENLI